MVNCFCSDIQVCGKYLGYSKRCFAENGISIQMDPEDAEELRQGTVDFYTFSYYMTFCLSLDPGVDITPGNLLGGAKNPYLQVSDWGWREIKARELEFTQYTVYQRKCMFQHPRYPWMLADLDYLVNLPDGATAILEIKTTNYNAKGKWEYDGQEIVPVYYESQGRHYMAVMNINRVYFCCLYGNNEDEVIIRRIDRDMDYEMELIALEENFWKNHVQIQEPPPYFEDNGELILESLQRLTGPSRKDAPPVLLTPPQAAQVFRYLELQEEKSSLNGQVKELDNEMKRLKAMIIANLGKSCTAVYEDANGIYTIICNPSRKESIRKDDLLRLKDTYPDIYAEYVSVSESRRFNVKHTAVKAA